MALTIAIAEMLGVAMPRAFTFHPRLSHSSNFQERFGMTQDVPFTVDLFGNFSSFGQDDLSAGLGLGVTALAGSPAVRPDNDDDPDPVPPASGASRPVGRQRLNLARRARRPIPSRRGRPGSRFRLEGEGRGQCRHNRTCQ
jgi:hypothetical protein